MEATGSRVSRFHVGDKVVTLFNQGHHAGPLDQRSMKTALGGLLDGTFRQHGVFSEEGLVAMPSNLSFLEASTLTCAGLTAWNALFGSVDHPLQPGDVVLTQGSGGVSLFGIQVNQLRRLLKGFRQIADLRVPFSSQKPRARPSSRLLPLT